ncbi:MAG: MATE family efflux transporter [Eubacteriales bacterium]|nr:MATE family efflux transporter [Eubacteriales bacterium]
MMRSPLKSFRESFCTRSVILLYLPILAEQAMNTFVSFISTVMVGHAGSAAISAVGVVSSLNNVIVNTLVSVSSGAAAVTAQYIGARKREQASDAVAQFGCVTVLASCGIALLLLLFARPLLSGLFGAAEPAVLEGARIYLAASALSVPFAAVMSLLSAALRGCGNSRAPMAAALLMNAVNTGVCAVTIYGFELGVTGAAAGLLAARIAGAALLTVFMLRPSFPLQLRRFFPVRWQQIRPVVSIGVPMGLDTAMFNGGKLLVQVFMTGMGTAVIAANSVVNSVISLIEIPGNAMCLLTITLVGYAVGAHDYAAARRHGWYTALAAFLLQLVVCVPVWFLLGPLVGLFTDDPAVIPVSVAVCRSFILAIPLWTTAFVIPSALRTAGDVRYTVGSSLAVMWVVRVLLSWVFGVRMNGGLMGIWIALYVDWAVRTALFVPRLCSGRWENRAVA